MSAIIYTYTNIFQDELIGNTCEGWELYTASPLSAFVGELGVQDPGGFWDPLGFTADGNVANFERRRSTEFEHGRISMLVTMGDITPSLLAKFLANFLGTCRPQLAWSSPMFRLAWR